MYPPPHVIANFGVFILGLLVGSTFGFQFFEEGVGGPWATFAGAGSGAIATVLGLWWLEYHKKLEERKRKQRAAIFSLGDALSEVCKYSQSGMFHLINGHEPQSEFVGALPQECIETLKESAEWFEGDKSKAVGVIGPQYQRCRSRIRISADAVSKTYRNQRIFDFAELHALASRLFEFSRGGKEKIKLGKVNQQELKIAIISPDTNISAIFYKFYCSDETKAFLGRRYPE